MHTLKSYSIDKLEINPFTKIGKEWALITAGDRSGCNTMTVSWGGIGVIWGKNVVYIFIRDSRYTKEFIDDGEFFSMAFLGEEYRQTLSYCGAHSGRDENKFEKTGLTPAFVQDIPYPAEADLVLLCKKMAAVRINEEHFTDQAIMPKWYGDGDMHTMYVGEIVEALARKQD